MKVEVDVKGGDNGARLPQVASNQPAWATAELGTSEHQADARVQAIIAANQSVPGSVPAARLGPITASGAASRLAVNMARPGTTQRSH